MSNEERQDQDARIERDSETLKKAKAQVGEPRMGVECDSEVTAEQITQMRDEGAEPVYVVDEMPAQALEFECDSCGDTYPVDEKRKFAEGFFMCFTCSEEHGGMPAYEPENVAQQPDQTDWKCDCEDRPCCHHYC